MSREDMIARIDAINKEANTSGMSLAAAIDGEVKFTYTYGMQDKEKNIPVTLDTIFRAASVTKHMSAMVLMVLVDRGLVDLDTDIGEYLGYQCRNPFYPDDPITIRHLMTHTSTYIEAGAYNRICAGEMPPYKLSEVLPFDAPGFAEDSYLKCRPGEQYSYSSFGTGIMGCIAEKVTGKKFADLAKEVLFDPIGIKAAYDPRMLEHPENVAVSYEPRGVESDSPKSTEWLAAQQEWLQKSLENKRKLYDLPIGEAYRIAQGNVHIRPLEVLEVQYVLMHDGVAKNGNRILSKESVDEMLKVQFAEGAGGASEENFRQHAESRGHTYKPGKGIVTGLNLHHINDIIEGTTLIGHYGRAYGAFTCTIFDPKTKKGVCVMTNGTDPKNDEGGHQYATTKAFEIAFRGMDEL